jgi:hypothetical protein
MVDVRDKLSFMARRRSWRGTNAQYIGLGAVQARPEIQRPAL